MLVSDDMELLQDYATGHSEEAFAALVSRHVNLVYSAALRSVHNPSHAEEITQAVFVTLARKSRSLRRGTVLSGWLYQTARLTASNFVRTEMRRQHREQQACIQTTMNDPEPESWTHIGPLLDDAMAQLSDKDRNAIVLRFFEGKALKEVGEAFGITEDAAKMRVNRALDKLRDFFQQCGITVSVAALAAAISKNSIQAAPAGLSASVAAGIAQGSALTVSSLTLVKGAIQIMTSTKISVAIGVIAAAVIIALQAQKVSVQKQAVERLQTQMVQDVQTSRAQQAEIAKLQEQNSFYAKTVESSARDVAKARARVSTPPDAKATAVAADGSKSNAWAEMFNDQTMRETMRARLYEFTKMMYAPLVKKLDLSPQQADKFCQILNSMELNAMETQRSERTRADGVTSMFADLQSLLGDDGMAQYNDFIQNLNDQSKLSSLNIDFGDNPLSDTQQQLLLQAMKTARQSLAANIVQDTSHANLSDFSRGLQEQEQFNQNILQQASAFLSPDQLQTLGTSQSNMIAMQKLFDPVIQKAFTNMPSGQ
jgi:RNA polymerase sigma factor (sigma-70 family)